MLATPGRPNGVRRGLVLGILGGLAAISVIGASLLLLFSWLFEGSGVTRGSIPYYVALPAFSKSLPVREECEAPQYRWRGRDGESIPFTVMEYRSRADEPALAQLYRDHFRAAGCTIDTDEGDADGRSMRFTCNRGDIVSADVTIGPMAGSCRDVHVGTVDNY